ncbi:IPT/TIG domain-containing protein [Flagellimonas olearia]|uniref:IPT/TIG domain-containing protein n=1 Tax=Flagellimonas olearia TaxID=552546 RepID=A0A444VMH0_9FLAO|nr:IPT/TIG domain-containing protein [Allomuricauda olearia]RYC51902.1 hypothetical protein DN53_08430 [Allomuricauda olearia]
MKKLHYLCLGLALVLAACGKDDPNPPDDPTSNPPTIDSFTPQEGTPGAIVVIIGTNFSTVKTENTVKFNGTEATVSIADATLLTVVVPNGATSGKITVTVDGQTAQSSTDFTVTEPSANAPTIDSFSPQEGTPGTIVEILGTNFSTVKTENAVKFNGTSANVSNATATMLTVEVPNGAETGPISVTVNGETAQSGTDFTVTEPSGNSLAIQDFSPMQGPIGTSVTINVTGISLSDYAFNEVVVKFNGIQTSVNQKSSSSVIVYVPTFATTGKISIEVGGETAVSDEDFTVTGPWRRIADFAGNLGNSYRRDGIMASLMDNQSNPKIFAGLGENGSFGTNGQKDIWSYDINTNSWEQKTDFPGGARKNAFSFVLDNKWYVGGGINNVPETVNDFWVYDPIADSWTGLDTPPVALGYSLTTFTINGKGYVFGVADDQNNFKRIGLYEYDPINNIWERKKDLGPSSISGFLYAAGFAINGKGYIVGGGIPGVYSEETWEYDPNNDTWTQKADFGGGKRQYHLGYSMNGMGYAGMGIDQNNNDHKDLWQFDPTDGASGSWTQKTDLPDGNRQYSSAVATDNKAYFIFGAIIGAEYEQFWEYTPAFDN